MRPIKLLFILLILFSLNIYAQKPAENIQPCDQDFARMLVEQQINEGKSVEETDKLIKIYLRSAEFLWKFDEPTARTYFAEAFNIAEKRFNEKGFEKGEKSEKNQIGTYKPDYRMEVVKAIAKKDGKWAKQLSEKLLKEYEAAVKEREDNYDKDREVRDLLGIATESAETNPELSLYFFRRAMQYPLDSAWYWNLYATARKNKALSDQVYSELLRTYANENPQKLLFLSAYPFAANRIFGVDKYQYGSNAPDNLTPNPNFQIQFLNVFFNRAERMISNPDELYKSPEKYRLAEISYIVSGLQDIEPIILQNHPNLLPRFNNVKSRVSGFLNEETKKNLEDRQKMYEKNETSFENKLEKLEEADSEGKLTDNMIVSLIFSLEKEEEYEKLESWIDKIKNEIAGNNTRNLFYFKRSQLAITEKRLNDAENFADKISRTELRAIVFLKIAEEQLKNDYQQNEAETILLRVSKLAAKAESSVEKAQVMLGLAYMFEKVNHAYALDELGGAINIINQLKNPDIFSTTVHQQIILDSNSYFMMVNTPGFDMETTFGEISKNDFQLSLAHAKSFSDKYFRTLAVLAVAGNCVKNAPKKKLSPDNKKSVSK